MSPADGSTMAGIGHNGAPEETPFDAFNTHVADLLEEARHHLDGEGVQTEGQAESVSKLLDLIRTAGKDADKARAAEKKPHDDAGKAVQARWKPLLDRCELAGKVCKDALAPYLHRQEQAKREAERAAREEAERQRQAAEAAMAASRVDDLSAREDAEAQARAAQQAERAATRASADRAQAKGGARATTLRTVYRPELTDIREACRHYWTTNPEAFRPLMQQLAEQDVRAGKRTIPGVTVHEDKVVV